MSIKMISALVAAAAFSTGAFAQSTYTPTQSSDYSSQPSQSYQGQSDSGYSSATGAPAYTADPAWMPQNGAYVDHDYQEVRGQPNSYARDMADGPMGTSPGS
ncbi:hypothetical protein PQR62_12585 [Herbaspirillum lusitanum]|jgi:hypothetical protein|uniref:Hydroxyquinol 1,2-dioxygenase n=1 Tax=Herbaspirillum lusitanum TaxID=213312 RepID=A0ABW9A9P0_9BURK